MALPIVKKLLFPITLPSSKKKLEFRPFTVGDERILLAAEQSRADDPDFYIKNTLQVLRGVINDTEGMLDTLPYIDVEYLLLQLRAKSVGEDVEIKFRDTDDKVQQTTINFEAFRLETNPEHEYKVKITDTIGLVMKDLTFADKIRQTAMQKKSQSDLIFTTLIDCIESVYDEDRVYTVGVDTDKGEVQKFIEGLSGVSSKLYKFIATMPQLKVDVKLKNGSTQTLTSTEIDFLA